MIPPQRMKNVRQCVFTVTQSVLLIIASLMPEFRSVISYVRIMFWYVCTLDMLYKKKSSPRVSTRDIDL